VCADATTTLSTGAARCSALTWRTTRRGALRVLTATVAGVGLLASGGPALAAPGASGTTETHVQANNILVPTGSRYGGSPAETDRTTERQAADPLLAELGDQVRAMTIERQPGDSRSGPAVRVAPGAPFATR
jgi:hypothetical protein